MKTVGIVLAAGSGKRMGSAQKKQYILLDGKPVLFYSLKAFEESLIDEVILVTSSDDIEYVRTEIVDKYGFGKVARIVEGGKERYHSVYNGLKATENADYVFIHDGARPMLTTDIIKRGLEAVEQYKACVVGMLSKDTVKIADESGFVATTPNRRLVWNIQTPQIFAYEMIIKAYEYVIEHEKEINDRGINITDDAMVLNEYSSYPVKLIEGSYENIKVTTPDDLILAEQFIRSLHT